MYNKLALDTNAVAVCIHNMRPHAGTRMKEGKKSEKTANLCLYSGNYFTRIIYIYIIIYGWNEFDHTRLQRSQTRTIIYAHSYVSIRLITDDNSFLFLSFLFSFILMPAYRIRFTRKHNAQRILLVLSPHPRVANTKKLQQGGSVMQKKKKNLHV